MMRSFLVVLLALFSTAVTAQCDEVADAFKHHLDNGYISDGQEYRALLIGDQNAEFNLTLYGGTTYRIVACSGKEDGNLIFNLLDPDRNVLFSNKNYENAPYWDFTVDYTLECSVEAQLGNPSMSSGCAVILVGFKD